MTEKKVTSIGAIDKTGIRKNISDILELHANKELESIVMIWHTKDDQVGSFWNGNELTLQGMLNQVMHTLAASVEYARENSYDNGLDEE